jgi:membrane protein YqaA with SNARE-associated domain
MSELEDARPVRRGGILDLHYKVYDWVLHWAGHPHAAWALFLIAFAESSFFPVPPDVLLMAMCLAQPKRSFWYAGVAAVGSVSGGVFGYLIGWTLWQGIETWVFAHLGFLGFTEGNFVRVQELYRENAGLALFGAAFSPIPYKVFTIAGGVFGVGIPVFILASLTGRSARFGLVALLLWWFGPPIKKIIDKYLGWLTLAFVILLIGGFWVISRVGGH